MIEQIPKDKQMDDVDSKQKESVVASESENEWQTKPDEMLDLSPFGPEVEEKYPYLRIGSLFSEGKLEHLSPDEIIPNIEKLLGKEIKLIENDQPGLRGKSCWKVNVDKDFEISIKNEGNYIWEIRAKETRGLNFFLGSDMRTNDVTGDYETYINVGCIYDLVNFLKDPQKGWKEYNKIGDRDEENSEIKRAGERVAKKSGWFDTPASYDIFDDYSNLRGFTLEYLFVFGLESNIKNKLKDLMEIKDEEEFWKALVELKPLAGKTVLEIGCGPRQRFLSVIKELGAECVGIDLQENNSRTKFPYYRIDITKHLPKELEEKRFDFVVATMTMNIEIMGSGQYKAVGNALHLLKKGGLAIFSPAEVEGDIFGEEYLDFRNKRTVLAPGHIIANVIKNVGSREEGVKEIVKI